MSDDEAAAKDIDDKKVAAKNMSDSDGSDPWNVWESDDEHGASDPYHNAATLLADDDISDASSTDVTFANINLALKVKGTARKESNINESFGPVVPNKTRQGCIGRKLVFGTSACAILFLVTAVTLGFVSLNVTSYRSRAQSTHANDPAPIAVPKRYANLIDVRDTSVNGNPSIPLLWDVRESFDGNIYQQVLSKCLGLVAAGGALGDPRQTNVPLDQALDIFERSDGTRYVNVFMSDSQGLMRAKAQKLVEAGIADVVYTSLIYEAASLFTETHQGKMFAFFHHPIHRLASVYHNVRSTDRTYKNTSLEEFLKTPAGKVHNNWLTRELAGGVKGPLDEAHFEIAKNVLRGKCLVGLSTHLDESLDRMLKYFGWDKKARGADYVACAKKVKKEGGSDYFGLVEAGSLEWKLIAKRNFYDMQLYEVIRTLFHEQQ